MFIPADEAVSSPRLNVLAPRPGQEAVRHPTSAGPRPGGAPASLEINVVPANFGLQFRLHAFPTILASEHAVASHLLKAALDRIPDLFQILLRVGHR